MGTTSKLDTKVTPATPLGLDRKETTEINPGNGKTDDKKTIAELQAMIDALKAAELAKATEAKNETKAEEKEEEEEANNDADANEGKHDYPDHQPETKETTISPPQPVVENPKSY